MAGGIGSRFWPMSTPTYPKLFIDVMGIGKSLIQLTADRFKDICPNENIWVVTSQKYVDIVKENEMMSNAVNYMLNQWKALENFIMDGRV